MEKKIIKIVCFENVCDDGYSMEVEYEDLGDGKIRKDYWLTDNINYIKVCIWGGDGNEVVTYEQELAYIKSRIKKNIKGYAAVLQAAEVIINDDDYFDNDDNEEE